MICDTCKDIITDDVEKMLEDVEADDNDDYMMLDADQSNSEDEVIVEDD